MNPQPCFPYFFYTDFFCSYSSLNEINDTLGFLLRSLTQCLLEKYVDILK